MSATSPVAMVDLSRQMEGAILDEIQIGDKERGGHEHKRFLGLTQRNAGKRGRWTSLKRSRPAQEMCSRSGNTIV